MKGDKETASKVSYMATKEIIKIYTDGAFFSHSGKPYAGYGYVIPSKGIQVSQPLDGEKTNNRAELTAIISAIKACKSFEDVVLNVYTDSQYAMRCFGETGMKYAKNNFKQGSKDVPNKDLIIKALNLRKRHPDLVIHHVKAHTTNTDADSNANAVADELADRGAITDFLTVHGSVSKYVLSSGKHSGELISEVPVTYLQWLISPSGTFQQSRYGVEHRIVSKYLKSVVPE